MRSAILHPQANDEAIEAASFYESRRAGLGAQWIEKLESAFETLREFPELGAPFERGTRIFRVEKFPYGIVYQCYPDHLFIIAVAHSKRKPGYWMERLN